MTGGTDEDGPTQGTRPERGTVGGRYRSSRLRVEALLAPIEGDAWERPVAACPGWRVRDVLAHLAGIPEDVAAGRISGPPTTDQTAAQVDRHRDDDPHQLLAEWSAAAPAFEEGITAFEIWPAFIDVLSHEHDLRAALGDRSFRDHDDVLAMGDLLTEGLPDGIAIRFPGDEEHRGDPAGACLATTPFELLRLRLGRRSRAQVLALDWDRDPGPAVDALFVFGPAPTDLTE